MDMETFMYIVTNSYQLLVKWTQFWDQDKDITYQEEDNMTANFLLPDCQISFYYIQFETLKHLQIYLGFQIISGKTFLWGISEFLWRESIFIF